MREPVTENDDRVLECSVRSITIGSDGAGHVYHQPEDAPVQQATTVQLITEEEIGNDLWAEGFKRKPYTWTEILDLNRYVVSLDRIDTVYGYEILFANGVDEKYYDVFRTHFDSQGQHITVSQVR